MMSEKKRKRSSPKDISATPIIIKAEPGEPDDSVRRSSRKKSKGLSKTLIKELGGPVTKKKQKKHKKKKVREPPSNDEIFEPLHISGSEDEEIVKPKPRRRRARRSKEDLNLTDQEMLDRKRAIARHRYAMNSEYLKERARIAYRKQEEAGKTPSGDLPKSDKLRIKYATDKGFAERKRAYMRKKYQEDPVYAERKRQESRRRHLAKQKVKEHTDGKTKAPSKKKTLTSGRMKQKVVQKDSSRKHMYHDPSYYKAPSPIYGDSSDSESDDEDEDDYEEDQSPLSDHNQYVTSRYDNDQRQYVTSRHDGDHRVYISKQDDDHRQYVSSKHDDVTRQYTSTKQEPSRYASTKQEAVRQEAVRYISTEIEDDHSTYISTPPDRSTKQEVVIDDYTYTQTDNSKYIIPTPVVKLESSTPVLQNEIMEEEVPYAVEVGPEISTTAVDDDIEIPECTEVSDTVTVEISTDADETTLMYLCPITGCSVVLQTPDMIVQHLQEFHPQLIITTENPQ